eukprot:RCo035415
MFQALLREYSNGSGLWPERKPASTADSYELTDIVEDQCARERLTRPAAPVFTMAREKRPMLWKQAKHEAEILAGPGDCDLGASRRSSAKGCRPAVVLPLGPDLGKRFRRVDKPKPTDESPGPATYELPSPAIIRTGRRRPRGGALGPPPVREASSSRGLWLLPPAGHTGAGSGADG